MILAAVEKTDVFALFTVCLSVTITLAGASRGDAALYMHSGMSPRKCCWVC